jgi:mono/diheme cytochrome c family protein
MRTRILILAALGLMLAGCSLAGDVTPPPALATQQAVQIPAQSTPVRAQPGETSGSSAVPVPPETAPSLMNGALISVDRCAPCHGADGLGQGSMASNLEIPPSPLADPVFALQAQPADWYAIVTEGRMDRFMPPFASLSDAQRWDVVAYALSLSTPGVVLAQGERLYEEACLECHGPSGEGGQVDIDLGAPDFYAGHSLESISMQIERGGNDMPAFADSYDSDQRLALAAYVRSLAFGGGASLQPEPTAGAGDTNSATGEPTAQVGRIEGQISNGTPGGARPGALDVTIVGFDSDQPVFNQDVTADSDGSYSVEGLEIVPGRIYGAIVEYAGVPYYSSAGHLLEEEPTLQLPITVYETTADIDTVRVDRLHLIFDFSVEGQVEVSQLWIISNSGDRTVVQPDGQNAIPIELPSGAANLRFADQTADALYTPTATGFVMHEPVRPDDALEMIFSFTLPYTRSLKYEQMMTLPVGAVVILTDQNAPEISGEDLSLSGEQPMGDIVLQTYQRPGLEKGAVLKLSLSGRAASAATTSPSTNLVIGIGALALALIVVGLGLRQFRKEGEPAIGQDALAAAKGLDRDQLAQAIAALDAAFEAGQVKESAYHTHRESLKRELMDLMSSEDD